jgi:hypothetical protein
MFRKWFQGLTECAPQARRGRKQVARPRLALECLEDRLVPSGVLPVSVDSAGTAMGDGQSSAAGESVSANGQFAVFTSNAANLVSTPINSFTYNVYLRNLVSGATTLVDVNSAGTAGSDRGATAPVISADGRYVEFISSSLDLTANDANVPAAEVYVRDMQLGQTFLVSLNSSGSNGSNANPDELAIAESSQGQLCIAYQSEATDLVQGEFPPFVSQIFLSTLSLGAGGAIQYDTLTTTLVSATSAGNGGNFTSANPILSSDGSTLAFTSFATNLNASGSYVDNSAGTVQNLFLYTRASSTLKVLSVEPATGTAATGNAPSSINNMSFGQSAEQSVSTSDQYVVFSSSSDNLVAGVPVDHSENVYRRDLVNGTTALVSVELDGTGGSFVISNNAVITPDGRYVAFNSNSLGLTANDTQGGVFVRDMQQGQTSLVSVGVSDALYPSIAETAAGQLVIAFQNNTPNALNDQAYVSTVKLDSSGNIQYATLTTKLASATAGGTGANGGSNYAVVSKDGSTVAFESNASNLPGESADSNGVGQLFQLFAYNVAAGTLTQVSPVPPTGGYIAVGSYLGSFTISDTGQFIAYEASITDSSNHTVGDILGWNRTTGQSTVVARTSYGALTLVAQPYISGDGSTIAYTATDSLAFLDNDAFVASGWQSGSPSITQLTHNETTGAGGVNYLTISDNGQVAAYRMGYYATPSPPTSIFVDNLSTNTSQDIGAGDNPLVISADGSAVVINSPANLVSGTTDFITGSDNVFAYNVSSNTVTLVSAKAPGLFTTDVSTTSVTISDNGRYLAYLSIGANDLVGGLPYTGSGGPAAVYGEDVQQNTLNVIAEGAQTAAPVISGDGSTIAFESDVVLTSNEPAGGYQIFSNDWLAASPAYTLVSVDSAGTNGGNQACLNPIISDNGQVIAFDSSATNLTSNDADGGGFIQVFVRELAGTPTTILASSTGSDGGNANSTAEYLNGDGNVVLFNSYAYDLVAGVSDASNNPGNVFAVEAGPIVSMTAPADNSITNNNKPTLSATATESGGTIASVQFEYSSNGGANWNNAGAPVTGAPFTFTFTTALADGRYEARAVATDNMGNSADSSAVSFLIDTAPPTVLMKAPANNSDTNNNEPTLSATALDNTGGSGVASVQFQLSSDAGSTWTDEGAPDTSGPFNFTFTTALNDGSYAARAVATDNAGNVANSATVSFLIDTVLPTVSMTAPANGSATNNTDPTLTASAQDNTGGSGLASVQFQYSSNGGSTWNNAGAPQTSGPFTLTFTTALADGDYEARAIATDQAGNVANSATISFIIDTVPPISSVQILPAFSAEGFTVSWSGSDNSGGDGIATYSVYYTDNGGSPQLLVGNTASTSTTFTQGVTGHTYGFYSIATDQAGNVQPTPSSAQASTQVIVVYQTNLHESAGTTTPVRETISTLLGIHYSDPDGSKHTHPGIAVFDTTGNGAWQYSTNGRTWTTIAPVSSTRALLLPQTDELRFLPAGLGTTPANLLFLAWDGSAGAAGRYVNAGTTGGAAAFSASAGELDVTLTAVTQAPLWLAKGTTLTPVLPGNVNPGETVAAAFGSFFSGDNGQSVGIAVVGATSNAAGAWQYALAGSPTQFTAIPKLPTGSAFLLSAGDLIGFAPTTSSFAGAVSLSVHACDGSGGFGDASTVKLTKTGGTTPFSSAVLTAKLHFNHAPAQNADDVTLPAIAENAPSKPVSVATLLRDVQAADADKNALGIALTGDTGNGAWQYELAGGVWQNLPATLSDASVLLLPGNLLLRFYPAVNQSGSAALTWKAWDGTTKLPEALATGGASAFSVNQGTATLIVTPSTHPPAWNGKGAMLMSVLSNSTKPQANTVANIFGAYFSYPNATSVGIAVSGVTGTKNGQWLYSTDGGMTWKNLPAVSATSALLLSGSDELAFVPIAGFLGTVSLTACAWDGGGTGNSAGGMAKPLGSDFSSTTLTATCVVNTAPILSN